MIELRLFARYREVIGVDCERVNLMVTTIGELRDALIARGEGWQILAEPTLCCARNEVLCSVESPVAEGDEVAFFPQMTGG
jgi:molybdopterin synthase sulfur carrier subunit